MFQLLNYPVLLVLYGIYLDLVLLLGAVHNVLEFAILGAQLVTLVHQLIFLLLLVLEAFQELRLLRLQQLELLLLLVLLQPELLVFLVLFVHLGSLLLDILLDLLVVLL